MKKKMMIFAAIATLTGVGMSEAREASRNDQPVMGEVVVTATRQEEKISSAPVFVTVIDEEKISNSTARTVPDLLRSEAGVHVSDITGNGRSFTVDLRGFGEAAGLNTLVLVDGRRINQPDLSGADWTLLSLARIKRIEVMRGGRGSVLYGDNAAGGVVNIITRDGGPTELTAEAAAGSYDTFQSRAAASGSAGDLSYAVAASYLDSDGYRDNSQAEASDAGASLRYFIGDRLSLDLSGDYHKEDRGLPGAIKESDFAAGVSRTDSLNPEDFVEVEDYYLKAGVEYFFLTDSSFRIDGSLRERDALSFSSFAAGHFTGDTKLDTRTVSPRLLLKETLLGLPHHLLLGLDYRQYEEEITNSSVYFGFPSQGRFILEKENYGYYLHDELLFTERFALSGGYRYDRVKYSFTPSTPSEATMDENLYTAGLTYTYGSRSYAYASYAKSFRYPVLDELFNFFTNTIDPGLVPQTSDDYEAGARQYWGEDSYLQVNGFQVETMDEIFYNPVTFANMNLNAESRRRGVEISMLAALEQFSLTGSYTYTDATIRGGSFAGKEVPNVPDHRASLGVILPLGEAFSLGLQGVYVGERPFISDFANRFQDQEDFIVVNAKLRYAAGRVSAWVDLNNLFDKKYSEYGGISSFPIEEPGIYPAPEMNVLAGISLSL